MDNAATLQHKWPQSSLHARTGSRDLTSLGPSAIRGNVSLPSHQQSGPRSKPYTHKASHPRTVSLSSPLTQDRLLLRSYPRTCQKDRHRFRCRHHTDGRSNRCSIFPSLGVVTTPIRVELLCTDCGLGQFVAWLGPMSARHEGRDSEAEEPLTNVWGRGAHRGDIDVGCGRGGGRWTCGDGKGGRRGGGSSGFFILVHFRAFTSEFLNITFNDTTALSN